MEILQGACLVAQSGGPTAVINASLQGAVEKALSSSAITRVFGGRYGIQGILEGNLCDFDKENPRELALLSQTPAAALGSCRYRLEKEEDFRHILEIFQRYDIRYFFYNGGNDSMDTCNKISQYLSEQNYPCRVIGIPKTIDNDLVGTDHCPGYPSAAKYVATVCSEMYQELQVYETESVLVVEIMGRNAGWLAGSSALAKQIGCGPDLIYLPEAPFSMEQFLADIRRVHGKSGKCLAVVSEGIRDIHGRLIVESADGLDSFGHTQLGGLAQRLANAVKEKLGIKKVRGIEPSLLQRCAGHCVSERDVEEAFLAGEAAVEAALRGETNKMVGFSCERKAGKYRCSTILIPLSDVANAEKPVPREWINAEGNGVTSEFMDYAAPLIHGEPPQICDCGLPRYAHLRYIPVE